MKQKKKLYCTACLCGLLAGILIVLVRCMDVAPIGPAGTSVGLASLNQAVHRLTGVKMGWYDLTTWLGIFAIIAAAGFALVGLFQLIKRKSLLKVDREILTLGGLYAAVLGLYVFFEKVIVNYRPVLMPGCKSPEASFPSSHTMLICVVMGSAVLLAGRYVKNRKLRLALQAFCALVLAVTVIGRLLSGVHWFTDILGGLLISGALLALFAAVKDQ